MSEKDKCQEGEWAANQEWTDVASERAFLVALQNQIACSAISGIFDQSLKKSHDD